MAGREVAYKSPEVTQAIDILCGWAIENDVNLEVHFMQDVSAGIIRRSDIMCDKTIPYMVIVKMHYGNSYQRMIFDPNTLAMYNQNENLDIIKESFDNMVKTIKEAEEKRKKGKK